MQPDLDDFAVAKELIECHGTQAERVAGIRGDKCLQERDVSGFRKWCRILFAIQLTKEAHRKH